MTEPKPGRKRRRFPWLLGCAGGLFTLAVLLILLGGVGAPLGILILLCLGVAATAALISWVWRRFMWKVRRRLFASFLLVSFVPLFLSLLLTLGVVTTYWILASGSVAKTAFEDISSHVSLVADIAASLSGAGEDPLFLQGSLPGLKVAMISSAKPDPLHPGKPLPQWLLGESTDCLAVLDDRENGRPVVVFLSLRRLSEERRLLLALPFGDEVAVWIKEHRGIVVLGKTMFVPQDADFGNFAILSVEEAKLKSAKENDFRLVVSDQDEEEITRSFAALPATFRYPFIVSHQARRWTDGKKGSCISIYFSTLQTEYDRTMNATGGVVSGLFTKLVPAVLGLFLLTYLICLSFGIMLAGAVSGGVSRLYRATLRYAAGDLDYRIKVRRRDQLGELADSMNSMAESVKKAMTVAAERERLSEELRLAQEVQRKLLPAPLREFRGVTVAGAVRPMSEVGGDTYEWRPISATELLVMVGDVSGHGLRPGLLAAMAKACLMTKIEHDPSHEAILQSLHKVTREALDRRLLMTVALMTLDLARRQVMLSFAGHPPCYRWRRGETSEHGTSGYPLGVRSHRKFTTLTLDLEEGDTFLLLSDGLAEARNQAGESWGYDLVERTFGSHAEGEASAIIEAILEDFDRFLGGAAPADDVTLVAVKVGSTGCSQDSGGSGDFNAGSQK